MDVLSHFRLRTKLTLLLGLSALAVVISIGASASLMQRRMFDDRIDKLRAVVQSTIGIAQSLDDRVVSHQFTREQALALLRDDVHAMRFDGGGGYVYAQTWTTSSCCTVPIPRWRASRRRPPPSTRTAGRSPS